MQRVGILPLVAAATALASCGGVASGDDLELTRAGQVSVARSQPIVMTSHGNTDFKPSCGPREVGKRLQGFAEALAVVDAEALRDYWWGSFRRHNAGFWRFYLNLGSGEKLLVNSYRQGVRLLEERAGLRLRFRRIVVGKGGGGEFVARAWSAKGPKRIGGKLGVACRKPTIQAMAGGVGVASSIRRCPPPAQHAPKGALIVCARDR